MRFRLSTLLVVMTLGGPILGWSALAVQKWRESQRMTCQPSLRQIGIALHNYHGDSYVGPKRTAAAPAKSASVAPFLTSSETNRTFAAP